MAISWLFDFMIVGFVMVGFLHVCVVFGRIFDWVPVVICHARVGNGGTCFPDTMTCSKKNAARGQGIELGLVS